MSDLWEQKQIHNISFGNKCCLHVLIHKPEAGVIDLEFITAMKHHWINVYEFPCKDL